jgi:hypothetical protein
MAGPVAEAGWLGSTFDFARSYAHDFEEARRLLTPDYLQGWLRGQYTQTEAMRYYCEKAREHLWRYFGLLEVLAWELTIHHILTADEVRAFCEDAEGQL